MGQMTVSRADTKGRQEGNLGFSLSWHPQPPALAHARAFVELAPSLRSIPHKVPAPLLPPPISHPHRIAVSAEGPA